MKLSKIFLLFFLFVVLVSAPFFLHIVKAEDVQTVSSTISTSFSKNYRLWDRSEEVRRLQKFLNGNGFILAQTGAGSPGNETLVFGLRTYRAVVKFQLAEGLPATGFFGPLTRAALFIFSKVSSDSVPGDKSNQKDGNNTTATSTAIDASANTATSSPKCFAPPGLTCYPGTAIIQPASPGNGYTAGFGGGGSVLQANASFSISGTPADRTVEATGPTGATITYTPPTATDTSDGNVAVSCFPTSGSTFNIGTTLVTCSATNSRTETTQTSFSVTVRDTTAPVVLLTNPLGTTTLSGTSVTLSATASDLVEVTAVQFQIDGANVSSEALAEPYSVTWDSLSVPDGSHTVTAIARDRFGNRTATDPFTITVDNNAPVRSSGSPSNTLEFGLAETPISLVTNETATCRYATTTPVAYGSMTSFTTTNATTHTTLITGLTSGSSYVYYIKCQDQQGNTNTNDYVISFTVAGDVSSPTASVTLPSSNSIVFGTTTLSASATDDVSVAGVQFKLDSGTRIGSEITSLPYSLVWDTTAVADGAHTIVAVARDGSNNLGTSSIVSITVDNTKPIISSVAAGGSAPTGFTVTWDTDENASSQVEYGTTTAYGATTTLDTNLLTSHSVALTGLIASTQYHFRALSVDAYGHLATSSDQIFTSTSMPDVTPPTVSITTPTNASAVTGSAVELTADASDNIGIAGVTFKVDGVDVAPEVTSAPYTVLWDSTTVAFGSHTIVAVARDTAGNFTTSSGVVVTNSAAGNVYYVSPSGNDSNNGTSPSTPWQTIAKINSTNFLSNDAVLLQGGQTFTGCMSFTNSKVGSTRSAPFTVGAYGAGKFTLQADCFGVKPNQAAAITINGVNGIIIQDGILIGNGGGAEYGIWIENTKLSSAADGFTIQRNDISGFYSTSTSDYGAEIFVNGYTKGLNHVSILNNTLHGRSGPTSPDDNGITGWAWTTRNIANILYQGNVVYDIGGKTGPGGNEGNGILANGVATGIIQNNIVHDVGANSTTCGGPAGIWAYSADNIKIQFNEAYRVQPVNYTTGCDWNGFDLDGGVTNSVMQYNYSHDNYAAGYLLYADSSSYAGGAWGTNDVRYNISENDVNSKNSTLGSILFTGLNGSTAAAVVNVYNNTVWNSVAGGAGFATQNRNPTGGIIANNIFAVSSDATSSNQSEFLYTNGLTPSAFTFKNNDYYAINGGTPAWHYGASAIYTSLSTWQATSTGGDVGATTTNPLLTAGGTGGLCSGYATTCPSVYKLLSTSPLYGTGLDLYQSPYSLSSLGTQDYFGNVIPNIGAGTGYNFGAHGAPVAGTVADTAPPGISITAPTTGATVAGNVTLTASSSDNVRVAGVQFYVDGAMVGSEVKAAPYSITWPTGSVTRASHTITAVARDAAGNYATSTGVAVTTVAASYYVSSTGNDSNDGRSSSSAWLTIGKVNSSSFGAGDNLFFEGGQTFTGCLTFNSSNVFGTSSTSPFTIGSYGTGSFTLNATCAGVQAGITLSSVSGITLQDAILVGNTAGTHPAYGVWIMNPSSVKAYDITVQRADISGFYSTSTSVFASEIFVTGYPGTGGLGRVNLLHNVLHGNQGTTSPDETGITGYGNGKNITDVLYDSNTVYDIGAKLGGSPGTEGNGIIAAGVDGGILQHNVVHDLGANTNTCGGPGGVWAYSANNVKIQFNEAYNIRPKPGHVGGCDWIGYDVDGSVTNSYIQYNYSHDNYGSGIITYETGVWGPNTIRYNISVNDNTGSNDNTGGGITLGGPGSTPSLTYVYNNTIWQGNPGPSGVRPSAISVVTNVSGGIIANNIFAAKTDMYGRAFFLYNDSHNISNLVFANNSYYAINGGTFMAQYATHIYTSLAALQAVITGGEVNATTINPLLGSGGTDPTCGGYSTTCPFEYRLQNTSPYGGIGLDLTASPYNLDVGTQDYFGNAIPHLSGTHYNIGAYGTDPANAPDTTLPGISLSVPTTNGIMGGTAVTLTSTSSDNIGVTGVQFTVDGTRIGSSGTTSPYAVVWDSTAVSDGAHTIAVAAHDLAGNFATSSLAVTVTNSAPILSAISTGTPSTTSATISWNTNIPVTSQVAYGATSAYGASTTLDATLTTTHSQTITGLSRNTTYHFKVMSGNVVGATTTSSDMTFNTAVYEGPGQYVGGALAWWGLRAYTASYVGNVAVICNSTACANVSTTNGDLVIPSNISSCSTATCTIQTLYDQSGTNSCSGAACNLTQAATSSRPISVPNCSGALFCIDTTSKEMTNTTGLSRAIPYSIQVSTRRNNSGGVAPIFTENSTVLGFGASAKQFTAGACTQNNATPDSAFHTFAAGMNGSGGNSKLWFDGGAGSGCNGVSTALSGTITFGGIGYAIQTRTLELGVWPGKFTTTQADDLDTNSRSYWGF